MKVLQIIRFFDIFEHVATVPLTRSYLWIDLTDLAQIWTQSYIHIEKASERKLLRKRTDDGTDTHKSVPKSFFCTFQSRSMIGSKTYTFSSYLDVRKTNIAVE